MKGTLLLVLCLAMTTIVSAAPPEHLGDQLLVEFHEYVPVATIQNIITKLGTKSDGVMFVGRAIIYRLKITNGQPAKEITPEFKKVPEVKSVSLNYVRNPN